MAVWGTPFLSCCWQSAANLLKSDDKKMLLFTIAFSAAAFAVILTGIAVIIMIIHS